MKAEIQKIVDKIRTECGEETTRLMEVCGTHTMAIHRYGLRSMLPSNLQLVSGPGCPVCVTPIHFIDAVLQLTTQDNTIICTFGDLMRVPGSSASLESEKMNGHQIRVVYSPVDALRMAIRDKHHHYIFIGVGFETTAPAVAAVIEMARENKVTNFSVACAHKTMPEALNRLAADRQTQIQGLICPGHVSAIIGIQAYVCLAKHRNIACVVSGFDPSDILVSVLMLCRQIKKSEFTAEIQYDRVVKAKGNTKALALMHRVFEPCDSEWRGLGMIPGSGLAIKSDFRRFDALYRFPVKVKKTAPPSGCICGDILKGIKTPLQCSLFAKECRPDSPIGACMVSSEGTCAAFFKYQVVKFNA
jgi:hydrogenase expression/formation protein HypD